MAGVEQLTQKILEDAKIQADSIKKQAQAEAQTILGQTRERVETQCSQIIAEANQKAEEIRERLVSVAQLNGRKTKLQVKQELIAQVFDQALDRLCSMPDEQYSQVLLTMISAAVEKGTEEIMLSERDRSRLSPDFLMKVNQQLQKKGLQGSLQISDQEAQIKGGFILKSGDILVNYSFEALIKQKYDDLAMEVAGLLFS